VQLGYGVNNYNRAQWGTPEMLQRIFYDQLCMKDAARHWAGPRQYRRMIRRSVFRYRRDFANNVVSACRSARRNEAVSVALRFLALDPIAIAWLPFAVADRVAWRRAG
jgi:hypothetical protein